MDRFCFVHAADLHLDTPFVGLRRLAPEVQAAVLEASLSAWDALVELTLERQALFLLIAGDLYDGAERGLRAQLRLRRGLARLSEAGVETLIVHGNHDPLEQGWSAIREWPPGVTIFGADRVGRVTIERGGVRLATVHGRSYAQRATHDNLALEFRRGDEPGLHIGLLHCNVGNDAAHARYSPCSIDDLARAGMDYWALGHVHSHRVLRPGDPWIVYPGNLQGRSPQPGERGAKGAVVVEVEGVVAGKVEGRGGSKAQGARVTGVEHVALDRVRFLVEDVDVGRCADLGAIELALATLAETRRAEHAGRGLLIRARLVGRSALQRELARTDALRELVDALRDRFGAMSPFVWWDSVTSEVQPPVDPRALRERDDFGAELLRLADALVASPEDAQALLEVELEQLPARIKGIALVAVDDRAAGDLVGAGADLAIEALAAVLPARDEAGAVE